MNNDGDGALYRQNGVTDFEKGDVVGRALANKNYRSSISQYMNKDNMEMELNALMKITEELDKIQDKSKKRLDLIKEQKRLQDELAKEMLKEANDEKTILQLSEKIQASKLKAAKEYLKVSSLEVKTIEEALEKSQSMLKIQEKLAKVSWADNLSKGLKEFSKELSSLSQALNLDKIVKGNFENFNTLRRSTMTSMGISATQFNQFKLDLINSVERMNANVGTSLYGIEDITNYLSNLNTLGIHSTSLAEQTVEAAIVGNKILGMSVETQAQFIKVMKRTDNKEILQRQNETIASILQSNLDVSKEQLELASANTAGLLGRMASLGYSDSAMGQMGVTGTAAQAMLTSAYGADAASALNQIFSEYYAGNTEFVGSRLSGQYGTFATAMNQGDAGTALAAILQSDYYNTLARMDDNSLRASAGILGLTDADLQFISIIRSGANKLDWDQYSNIKNMTSEDAKKELEKIQANQAKTLTLQEKVSNWLGLKIWSLPWEAHMTLADAAYTTFLLSKLFEIGKSFADPNSLLHRSAFGKIGTEFAAIKAGNGSMLALGKSVVVALGGLAALLGGIGLGIRDVYEGQKNGIAPLSAFFLGSGTTYSNVLLNALKWTLITAGVMILAGFSALPVLIGAAVAAALGALLGLWGMKKNQKTIADNNVGGPVFSGVGGAPGPGVGGASKYTTSAGINVKPWWITDRYGWRMLNGKKNYHHGIDLPKGSGTPIGSNTAGKVVAAQLSGYNGGRGTYVVVEDANGLRHNYFHMKKNSLKVKKGDYVNPGQTLGLMGNTGHSFGSHLHYQINKNGKSINPEAYVTRNIMEASATGRAPATNAVPTEVSKKEEEKADILGKFISEDTRQKEATAAQYADYFASNAAGVGGATDSGITGTVNKGFGDLLNKLDELSSKQEDQERIIAALTGKMGTSLFKY